MTGLMETVESQRQAFHEFPQPFGNPANNGRDSHIPTAPTTGGKLENHTQVSHFPASRSSRKTEGRKRTVAARRAVPSAVGRKHPAQAREQSPKGGSFVRLLQDHVYWNQFLISGSFFDWNMLNSVSPATK